MKNATPIRRALLSVSDKTGILAFATALHAQGVELLSTGGTARLLANNGIPVIEIANYTGHPEIMDGRVKTLHPKIHGGILARRGIDEIVMEQHAIEPIDLVAVNLYPFAQTIAQQGCTIETAIENIDIGGPTMVRASAKNHRDVTIIVNATDYDRVLNEMQANDGMTTFKTRFDLAVAAFEHTAAYDGMIANHFGTMVPSYHQDNDETNLSNASSHSPFPRTYNTQLIKKQDLRYGENSHQLAAFYVEAQRDEAAISTAIQLQGKALSYNNIADTDAALECVKEFDAPACVIVKHANPCGVAIGKNLLEAYNRAYQTDPTSAFGGIVAFNGELDEQTARSIIERQFVEVIIAPSVTKEAREAIAIKPNVRLLECGQWTTKTKGFDYKRVNGGLLVQDRDQGMITIDDLKVVTKKQPTAAEMQDLIFCWKVAKFVKSNAIVYAKDQMTIGIGAGQMSRIYSARVAAIKAADEGLTVTGSVMASDAFFPFRDGIDAAAATGIGCIIQPGGSIRDDEIIAAADQHDIAMVFTAMRHFRH